MRMQEIGSQAVTATLLTISAVTDLVGDRIFNMPFIPQDVDHPAIMHFSEPGGDGYTGPIDPDGEPERLNMRYLIRVAGTPGESTDAIDPAAKAIAVRFANSGLLSPSGYAVRSLLTEHLPQLNSFGIFEASGVIYRMSGDYYAIDVLKTGA